MGDFKKAFEFTQANVPHASKDPITLELENIEHISCPEHPGPKETNVLFNMIAGQSYSCFFYEPAHALRFREMCMKGANMVEGLPTQVGSILAILPLPLQTGQIDSNLSPDGRLKRVEVRPKPKMPEIGNTVKAIRAGSGTSYDGIQWSCEVGDTGIVNDVCPEGDSGSAVVEIKWKKHEGVHWILAKKVKIVEQKPIVDNVRRRLLTRNRQHRQHRV